MDPKTLKLFSTCPQSKDHTGQSYRAVVEECSQWSERQGFKGMLIYTDNSLVDPWMMAQIVLEATESLQPLVAVQPVYMHPYSAAKMVATLGFIHRRKVALNLVAGGFRNDLLALGDDTPHDDRYTRVVEYAHILLGLLRGDEPVSFEGKYYQARNLRMVPELPPDLFPDVMLSGSSQAGLDAARTLAATAIRYPQDPEKDAPWPRADGVATGLRVGIIARETSEAAWDEAWTRFPDDRRGEITRQLATRTSDSRWHLALAESAPNDPLATDRPASPYWLHPFQQYHTNCPYLVGSYDEVAAELSNYTSLGDRTMIVDIPHEENDLATVTRVVERLAEAP